MIWFALKFSVVKKRLDKKKALILATPNRLTLGCSRERIESRPLSLGMKILVSQQILWLAGQGEAKYPSPHPPMAPFGCFALWGSCFLRTNVLIWYQARRLVYPLPLSRLSQVLHPHSRLVTISGERLNCRTENEFEFFCQIRYPS